MAELCLADFKNSGRTFLLAFEIYLHSFSQSLAKVNMMEIDKEEKGEIYNSTKFLEKQFCTGFQFEKIQFHLDRKLNYCCEIFVTVTS